MREYGFSLTLIFPYKNKIYDFAVIRENTGQRISYSRIIEAMFITMIGPINPYPYIHWLNEKILPEVYSESSQTSKMELFMKIRSRH